MMNKNVHTFIGCDSDYESSTAVIFGAPFDGTASYRPGARFAPSAIRNESYGIETYSPYQSKDMSDIAVFDGGDLELPFGNPEKVLKIIEIYTQKLLADGKLPCMVGGEHLITLGAFQAVCQQYPEVHIVHLDAHTDLREEYLGERLSHSTVIRRCHDLIGDGKIHQFGIRSGEREEFEFAKKHTLLHPFYLKDTDKLVQEIGDAPVYLTLDLDVLDPSVFPGTGTPEAGGASFMELMRALKDISALNIVAMDLNELSPPCDLSGASTALACKVLRELLLFTVKEGKA